ncbi:MAG TPA: hypothetical protein VGD10_12915 [Allosphingosinicella sp.]|uniref:LapA family protein n=1 Tax=Allosphingosinicella sp. TaxID=2823234 RepID=UPI002EDAB372
MAWSTTEWFIVGLAFLIGLCLGLMMCSGRKWKRRYKDESRIRAEQEKRLTELERSHKHHEAELIAARARAGDATPPPRT